MAFDVANEARNRTVQLCVDRCWEVHIVCAGETPHHVRIGSRELLDRFPPDATLDAIAARLKCSECGARDGGLGIMQDQAATSARDRATYESGKGAR